MAHNETLQLLLARRSVLANNMCEPGPDSTGVQHILQAAHRVPDHGKIGPWRFIVFNGDSRKKFGHLLSKRSAELDNSASDKLLEFEQHRFLRAPLVIAVVSSPVAHTKIPEWEQVLSAGAACQNILLASQALGFCAQWLTEWYAFDSKISDELGLKEREKIAGFIYIGSAKAKPTERARPDLDERITYW